MGEVSRREGSKGREEKSVVNGRGRGGRDRDKRSGR